MTLRSLPPSSSSLLHSFHPPLSPSRPLIPHPFPNLHQETLEKGNICQGIKVTLKRKLRGGTGTENAIRTEIETETETGIEIGTGNENNHANPLEITTPSPPAIRLRGAMKKLEELPRRPSGDGLTGYRIRGERTPRHLNNIPRNMSESLRGNKKLRLLPRLLGGRSQPLIRLQTPT
jgi:hypothetical protein